MQSEIKRLSDLGWYALFEHMPTIPFWAHPNGGRARKLTTNVRRITDAGFPRQEDLRYPIERASVRSNGTLHLTRGSTPIDSHNESARKHAHLPRELKVNLPELMLACSILMLAAHRLQTVVYTFGDDFKDMFNQFKTHPSTHYQTCLITISLSGPHKQLLWVLEKSMGFGYVAASNIAQRIMDALCWILEQRLDALEAQELALSQDPRWLAWIADRCASCTDPNAGRLYWVKGYTDDVRGLAVGPHRMWRMLKTWCGMMKEFGFIMTSVIKRQLGTSGSFIGANMYTSLGLIQIMEQKSLVALSVIQDALRGQCPVSEYKRLLGKLQDFHFTARMDSTYFHGLYEPTKLTQEAGIGPTTKVRVHDAPGRPSRCMIRRNLQRWAVALSTCPGAPMAAALPFCNDTVLAALVITMASDAALRASLDRPGDVPGMGGTMHGMYWHLQVDDTMGHLTIPALELLALIGNLMIFAPLLATGMGLDHRIHCLVDAKGSLAGLRRRARSLGLQYILHEMHFIPEVQAVLPHTRLQHLYGVGNSLADWASRGRLEALESELRRRRCRPRRLQPTPTFLALVSRANAYYERRPLQ